MAAPANRRRRSPRAGPSAAESPAGRSAMTGTGRRPAGVTVRPMTGADAAQVLAIYQAGLDGGEASFETRAPA